MPSAEFENVAAALRANPLFETGDLLEMRARLAGAARNAPRAPDARSEAVDAGGVPAEWVTTPEARAEFVLVHFHGGAYAMGTLDTHRGLATHLSRAARARVLMPDYRLAPEHPHPAAVEDALSVVRWLRAMGVPASRLVLSGDSAGGGLAAATLVALRDAGEALPAAGVLISPWLDLTGSGASHVERADEDVMITPRVLELAADAYCKGCDPRAPLVSPLFADLAGLPPLLLQVGTAEVLLDDSRAFAARADAAGVDVTLEVAEAMFHVWHTFADSIPEAREAIARVGAFLAPRWR